ncbi:MAG: PAS domain S-box protein [Gammaproteobacteria bacterium]|nr:PAS domain S-box protein [Gammaproteobacteria bacterium]
MEARVKPRQRFDEKPPSHSKSLPTRLAGLEQFLDAAPDAMVGVDNDGKIVLVNWQAEKLLGYTIRELTGRRIEMLLPERFQHQPIEHRKNYLANARVRPMGVSLGLYARRKDGVEIPVEINLSPLETEEGLLVLSSIRDITERKRKEKQLQASEARLRRLLETTNAIPWEANAKTWQFTYVGPQAVKLLGYPVDQWYEQDFWAGHIDPEDREYAIDFCLKSSQRFKDYEFEYRMIAADGRIVWMHDIVSVTSVNGAPETLRGFMIDITERKQTEQALRKREQQLGAFFENSATDINLKDAEGRYILTSRQFEKTFGLARGEAEGKFPHDIFPKDFADHVRAQDLAVLRTGKLIHQEDLVPDRDPPITLLVSKFPISEETGEVIGLGVIATDITERKRAEQALREAHDQLESRVQERTQELAEANAALRVEVTARKRAHQELAESETRHRRLLETTNALPWEANAKSWCFSYVGPQAVKLFGYPLEQWYEKDFWVQHIHPEDREYAIDFCLKSSQRCQDFEFEYRMIAADGRSVWLHDIVSVVCENGVPHSLRGFMVDISNRKQAEEDVRMAQKEAALHRDRLTHLVRVQTLGEMAAGIAHEINQPLAAIDSYARACQRRLLSDRDNPEKLEELVGKIAGQAKRAGHVVSRLRAMMQRRTVEPNRININTLLQDVVSLAETDAGLHDCRLDLKPYAPVTYVIVDAIQIQQVVLNLIRNGIEAMEKNTRGNEKVITVDATKSDADHIVVNVADRGVGVVAHSEADDVFEPFYSTKHSGMGMGLAISRNIIRAHGGEIWYSRNRAGGTTFHFSLPTETSEI